MSVLGLGLRPEPPSFDQNATPGYPPDLFSTGAEGIFALSYAPKDSAGSVFGGNGTSVKVSETGASLVGRLWASVKAGDLATLQGCVEAGAPLDCRSKVWFLPWYEGA